MKDDSLKFIDSAFTCEVTLTGTSKILYEKSLPQFNRLKGIKSLGIVSHIDDIAMHNRHQHLVGMMRIFNKLSQQPKNFGLPKQFLWSFWCILCFSQSGHAAFSYNSEKAVLLACHMDSNFKNKFIKLLRPVIDNLDKCNLCNKQCAAKLHGSTEAEKWLNDMINENDWKCVHEWIAALKLINNNDILEILKNQQIKDGNLLGFSMNEALKILVCPDCQWVGAVQRLKRLDYVVRDLAFAGTLGIQVDVDGLVAEVDKEHKDWALLENLDEYLQDTLYEDDYKQTISVLYQRALASYLIKKKISLEMLFGLDSDYYYSDEELTKILKKSKIGKEVFDRETRKAWKTWPVSMSLEDSNIPSEIEKSITGSRYHLTNHIHTRVTCIKMREIDRLGLSICHRNKKNRPQAKQLLNLYKQTILKRYPLVDAEEYNYSLFNCLIDRECKYDIAEVVKRLVNLPIDIETLKGSIAIIKSRISDKSTDAESIAFRIGENEYPIKGSQKELFINTIHAAINSSESIRKNMGISLEDATSIMWLEILNWQSIYFTNNTTISILKLIDSAQELLAQSVVSNSNTACKDLEIYTLLESLKNPDKDISFRCSLPNLILYKDDGNTENEYDVVSILFKKGKDVEIWIWGVTTQENGITDKRAKDSAKIQKLKNLLADRWESDITIRENYIFKNSNVIYCEIDGRRFDRIIG